MKKTKKLDSLDKPVYILDKPKTQYDIKPEVWYIGDTNINHLVYYPSIISSRLISYKPSELGYKFESLNSIYICDWMPTIKRVSIKEFKKICDNI